MDRSRHNFEMMQRMWLMLHAVLLLLGAVCLVTAQNEGNYYNVQQQQTQQQPLLPQQQPTSQYDINQQQFGGTLNPNLNNNIYNNNPNPTPYGGGAGGIYNDLGTQDDYKKRLDGTAFPGYEGEEPSLSVGKSTYNSKALFLETLHNREPTYFIVASRMVRPGLIYQVSVSILQAKYPITVHASISCDGVQISGDSKDVKEGVPETLLMRIPPTSVTGDYNLRVEGFYQDVLGGVAFLNYTRLDFSQRSMTIFVQTDKPLYMQGETVRFRTIPITTELKGFDNAIDVYMLDPNKHILKRWLSR